MHLHRGGHAFHQPYTLGNHAKMDPHGNALGQSHPCKDRVHIGDAGGVEVTEDSLSTALISRSRKAASSTRHSLW